MYKSIKTISHKATNIAQLRLIAPRFCKCQFIQIVVETMYMYHSQYQYETESSTHNQ